MRTKERTEFSERVRLARLAAGLSQKLLAEKAGMSQAGISEMEINAKGSPNAVRIAQVLGVRAEWLVNGSGEMRDAATEPPAAARLVASEQVAHELVGKPGGTDYRTIAITLAASLEESGIELSVKQFMQLLEATYAKLRTDV